jgi:hypothetical protein
MISIGAAIRASFDAPIRFMESYHAYIPNESDKEATIRAFQLLVKIFNRSLEFLKIIDPTDNNINPDNVMLKEESTIGEILTKYIVRYSIMIDSKESARAYTKTIHDL